MPENCEISLRLVSEGDYKSGRVVNGHLAAYGTSTDWLTSAVTSDCPNSGISLDSAMCPPSVPRPILRYHCTEYVFAVLVRSMQISFKSSLIALVACPLL
jgi:hypothetical protein